VRHSRNGPQQLRVSADGDPAVEKMFRMHFISPVLPERTRAKLEERLQRPPEPVVFEILRDSRCSECGVELLVGSLLYMEAGEPLCLACARLNDLAYLPAGDTALTRRTRKYSQRRAVVVRFSRSRRRYERQGILVDKAALKTAEAECTRQAEERRHAGARPNVSKTSSIAGDSPQERCHSHGGASRGGSAPRRLR
jgi:hypothetical protein